MTLNPFQLILNPIRDWNLEHRCDRCDKYEFQLILNPTRDWNQNFIIHFFIPKWFQLILNPTRDWNVFSPMDQQSFEQCSN